MELQTTNHISSWTDSNGIVARNEPGLMDGDVYFAIHCPGCTFPGGGKTLKIARGGRVDLKVKRLRSNGGAPAAGQSQGTPLWAPVRPESIEC